MATLNTVMFFVALFSGIISAKSYTEAVYRIYLIGSVGSLVLLSHGGLP